jgi:hypothetical protein
VAVWHYGEAIAFLASGSWFEPCMDIIFLYIMSVALLCFVIGIYHIKNDTPLHHHRRDPNPKHVEQSTSV